MIDYEIHRTLRRCMSCQRELAEGEAFYSALVSSGHQVQRQDECAECWKGAPDKAVGWWKSHVPHRDAPKTKLAPNDVLLGYFLQLEGNREMADTAYVLALLLVRRRVLRVEETLTDSAGREVLVLYCARDEATHRISAVVPSDQRVVEIQAQLAQLLFASAA
jgi:hypothetical protein